MSADHFADRSAVLTAPPAAEEAPGFAMPAGMAVTDPLLAPAGFAAAAQRGVDAVLRAVEQGRASGGRALRLQFAVGGNDLAVRVELRGGEVWATFRTDSAELRAALAQEWHAAGLNSVDRTLRLAPAVITSQSRESSDLPAFGGDGRSMPDGSGGRRAAGEPPSSPAFAMGRALPSGTAATAPASLADSLRLTLPTALHLHTLA